MDRIAKLLLVAIALGLWANIAIRIVSPAKADDDETVRQIEQIVDSIAKGTCHNHKICG